MRKNSTMIALCFALTLSMLLVSCGGEQEPTPATSPLTAPDTSPLPTPTASQPEPSPLPAMIFPTSQPGLATVTGVILQQGTQSAPRRVTLYLGEVIQTTDPNQPVVGLDKAIAPEGMLDINTGAFAFYDVPPDEYALMLDRPLSVPILVDDPDKGGTLLLTIESDENIDLGTLYVAVPE